MVIKNIAKMDGKEIVQLYVTDKKSQVPRPLKELKGFQKVDLKVGESKELVFELTKDAFSFWSVKEHDWMVESGEFEISIGSSSRDLALKTSIVLN
jgi:beta-glucosidase